MPGFATSEATKSNAWALMSALGVDGARRSTSSRSRSRCCADLDHPFAEGEAGLRRHLRERAGGPAHRLPLPPRQPAARLRRRHRRPLRARARLVHLRRRRPHEPLQRQRLGAEDADPAPDPLGDAHRPVRRGDATRCSSDPRHRDLARARAGRRRAARSRAPKPRSAPTSCTTSSSTTSRATACRPRRSPSSPGTPGATRAACGRSSFPRGRARAVRPRHHPQMARGLPPALLRVSQFKRSALPNGPKIVRRRRALPARRLARAVGRVSASVWIDELRRNVPEA